ncbi:Crp/Fnr family transcriptional regulator [Nocardioides sp. MJB4]|uniref:Crp/Fnr family transcriptional regulator n=2 Tax=Nocardioides donggukensis TaxID=2774019 RepID=A0A927K5X9_9ACTN|nr:Crp/Fnr family transcriptional regulator [Nocardioides donggukensis]
MSIDPESTWCLAEVDIFADLSESEMQQMAEAAPMRTYPPGAMLYTPQQRTETLFILKQGRVRIFRVSADGRALTTAILTPGTIFGEMVVVGQLMHDNFAEALEETVVCVMSSRDVHRLLLADPRIAARISETLGRRLALLEQRLSDAIFKSVPERVADTLVTLSTPRALGRTPVVQVTHEQLAALVGTSRETTTKVLGDLADRGLIGLGRGRIHVLDVAGLRGIGDRDRG